MELRDRAYVLSAKPHGERAYVVTLLGEEKGKVRAFWRGSSKQKSLLDPLTLVSLEIRKRLNDQLGTAKLELEASQAHKFFHDEARLAVLHYVSEILAQCLADEEPHPQLFQALTDILSHLPEPELWQRVIQFECILLADLGYGLTLDPSESVRESEGDILTYLSPKTGRAIGAAKGAPYADKLLKLPRIFGGPTCDVVEDCTLAFQVTGHFLGQMMPLQKLPARQRLLDLGAQKGFTAS